MKSQLSFSVLTALLALAAPPADAELVIGGDPRVNPADFRITTFASGLNYPVGMVELADGSVLVAISKGDRFFASTAGQLVRLADTDGDGVADAQSVLFDDVPGGGLSALRMAGDLVFTCGQGRGKPISILRTGPTPADPLTLVGSIQINYSGDWLHPHSALAARALAGQPGRYELYFQLGSEANFAVTTRTLSLTSTIGVEGPLHGDGFYRVTLSDDGQTVTGSDLTQIATGLRNAAGFAFAPGTGDLYLQDNGIDGLVDVNESHSADELNFIANDALGGAIEDFGFPDNYTRYRTGVFVGGGGIAPLVTFQPLPDPQTGSESEGAADITFAPPGFPPGLNEGLFVGFHGKFSSGGLANEENPLVYVDPKDGTRFHFVANDRPDVGHLDGLLATDRDLFVADMSPSGGYNTTAARTGVIYQIHSLYDPGTAVEALDLPVPGTFSLSAPSPNPFNPETSINFSVPGPGGVSPVSLKVYGLNGQLVATLADQLLQPGAYQVRWAGTDQRGAPVASGVYLCQLKVGQHLGATQRMTLLK
ncbi:MAG: hypothetical protein IT369_08175 [Candidatus Latescibacteria bacterium]|nr:hypothetical protein [Candidatus Latescibacterota bacterium]